MRNEQQVKHLTPNSWCTPLMTDYVGANVQSNVHLNRMEPVVAQVRQFDSEATAITE
jgi:hypothetical protein